MDEFAGYPISRSLPHGLFVFEDRCAPGGILPEMDGFVIGIKQGDAGAEIGHEQEVATPVDVGGEKKIGQGALMVSVEIEPLEPTVGPVGDDEQRIPFLAVS